MLLRWPKTMNPPTRRGASFDAPVEVRDVLPTLLDAAEAPPERSLDGRSLLDLVRETASPWRGHIDLEHDICYSPRNHWNALTDGKWKYIYHAKTGREQLFHLSDDPGELRDLASDRSSQNELKGWRERMVGHLSVRGPAWVKDQRLVRRPSSTLHSPNYPGAHPAPASRGK